MTLTWFLENASGFYILLLEELRQVFGLEIPFLQSSSPYGISDMVAKLRPGPEPLVASVDEDTVPERTLLVSAVSASLPINLAKKTS